MKFSKKNSSSNFNLTKEWDGMKSIKIGIVGVCLCLLGVAFSTNNVLAYGCATIGLVVAIIGCFTKDK